MRYWLKLIGTTKRPVDVWDEDYVDYAREPAVRKGDLLVLQATGIRRLFGVVECRSNPERNDGLPNKWGTHRTKIKDIVSRRSPIKSGPRVRDTKFTPRSYGPGLIEITKEDFADAMDALSGG